LNFNSQYLSNVIGARNQQALAIVRMTY